MCNVTSEDRPPPAIATTRRQFARTVIAGLTLPTLTARWGSASPVGGVRLGVQTYSFREIARAGAPDAVDVILASMKACGLDECELWSPQIEATDVQLRRGAPAATPAAAAVTPADRQQAREALRAWRLKNGPDFYESVRRRFSAVGMSIYAYNLSFNESFTDEEITRGFEAARALGADVITASTTLRVAKRLVPFAERHRIPVAMHNHSNVTDPNEFATPQSFAAALAMSPLFRINLDIGHFTAANFDPLAFLEQHHDAITNLHLKDRKKAQGDNVPWGTGDTPIKETLAWLKRRSSPVRAYVEYEYPGTRGPVAEVTACAQFARTVLTA
jgi:sugar phosphate isomerase/epimerase